MAPSNCNTIFNSFSPLMKLQGKIGCDDGVTHQSTDPLKSGDKPSLSLSPAVSFLQKQPDRIVTDASKVGKLLKSGQIELLSQEVTALGARRALTALAVSEKIAVVNSLYSSQSPVDLVKTNVSQQNPLPVNVINSFASLADNVLADATTNDKSLLSRSTRSIESVSDNLIDKGVVSGTEIREKLYSHSKYSAPASEKMISSSRKMCDALANAIATMEEGYLNIFQQAVEKNTTFYSQFIDFNAKLSNYISAEGDKTLLNSGFGTALEELIAQNPVPGSSTTLYPVMDGYPQIGASKEECEAWANAIGLKKEKSVYQLTNGTYIVHIDISPLQQIKNNLNSTAGKYINMEFNSAKWSAFQTGLDLQKDVIQNSMQTLTQKYSNANSAFDNLVKVLSSMINTLLESDKAAMNI